ncbi:MAG: DUF1328 domain-containing protein, partial [Chloroflexi bacterium]|nr:DUF1328 domain-containing protein [Chloroflexota bacterium]
MLRVALLFLALTLAAALLGFGGLAGAMAGIARLAFYLFLAIFI